MICHSGSSSACCCCRWSDSDVNWDPESPESRSALQMFGSEYKDPVVSQIRNKAESKYHVYSLTSTDSRLRPHVYRFTSTASRLMSMASRFTSYMLKEDSFLLIEAAEFGFISNRINKSCHFEVRPYSHNLFCILYEKQLPETGLVAHAFKSSTQGRGRWISISSRAA